MLELDFDTPSNRGDGFVYNMDSRDYRKSEGICSSDLKKLITSPFEYFRGVYKDPTPAMVEGTLLHLLLCEPHKFDDQFSIFEGVKKPSIYDAEGRYLIGRRAFEEIQEASDYIKTALLEYDGIDLDAMDSEVSYFGEFRGHKAKSRIDKLTKDKKIIIDIKKTKSADSLSFTRQACDLHYTIQEIFYREIINADAFYWLAIETTPITDRSGKKHYRYNLFQSSDALREKGERLIETAFKVLENREIFDKPMHPSEFLIDDLEGLQKIKTINPPLWYIHKD